MLLHNLVDSGDTHDTVDCGDNHHDAHDDEVYLGDDDDDDLGAHVVYGRY